MNNEKPPLNTPEVRPPDSAAEPNNIAPLSTIKQQPINGQPTGLNRPKKRFNLSGHWVIFGILALLVLSVAGALAWYYVQLKPRSDDKSQLVLVTVEAGSTPDDIGKLLVDKSVIRSALAFNIYTRLSSTRGNLQAGSYRLSPAESTPDIVKHLVNGSVDQFSITFFPGAMLADTSDKPQAEKQDVTSVLERAGYSAAEISAALSVSYNSPLLQGRPTTANLEGYVYGETYNFNIGATAEDILGATFDEFYEKIIDNDIIKGFAKQDLTLYQGITLASIVQREASNPEDQKQVAQVFLTRLEMGMPLGSDVTFIYAANKMGVEPISTLQSPYNTRINVGLPPGPIASPGLSALVAVASPASGDYVYFVAGDDGRVHFARTLAEHEANISNYCTTECNKP